jgi:hypothetical protein
LTREDHLRAQEHDTLALTSRDRAVHSAMARIIYWREFPAETREWARIVLNSTLDEEATGYVAAPGQFKAWWEHNKEAVLAKDYAKATWLPTEVPAKIAQFWKPPGAKAPALPSAPRPAPAPAAVIPPAPTGSLLPWLLGGLAALALTAAAALKLRRR